MASDAAIFVRIDSKTKAEAEAILSQLGVTPSSLINMLYHKVILTGSIPFSINLPNREPIAAGGLSEDEILEIVQKGVDDVKEGRVYTAHQAEEMFNEMTGRKKIDNYSIDVAESFYVELYLIYKYISEQLNNISAANKLADEVWDMVYNLSTLPTRFQIFKNNIRKVSVGKYNIYYCIDEQLKIVYILHILYQGMNTSQIAIG